MTRRVPAGPAKAYFEAGKYKMVRHMLKISRERWKGDPGATYLLALTLDRLGVSPKKRIAAYRQALEVRDPFPEAHNNLGVLLYRQRDCEGAVEQFAAALKAAPDLVEPRINLDRVVENLTRYKEAMGSKFTPGDAVNQCIEKAEAVSR